MLNTFIEKINNKEAIIAIVGLGYVGLPLMLRFAEVGYRVIGIDVNDNKNAMLNRGQSYIQHISSEKILALKNRISATNNFEACLEADAIILCVPTPLNKYREPDLSYLQQSMAALLPHLRAGQLISLESTTYPGTTQEELKPSIESRGLRIGQDVFLVYSPEREDPGNERYSTSTIPKIYGGDTENCQQAGEALYSAIIEKVVRVSSTQVAEMTKLMENIHRSVNIGLVNEMKVLAEKMKIDIHEVIDAAATKPFGFVPYYPGPGIGGHCIPIDPFYLTWKAREYGIHTRFIELAGEINKSMPEWVVTKISDALNSRERALKNCRILILGVAYKSNIEDTRESPALEIMALLEAKGALLAYSDPHVPELPPRSSLSLDATLLSTFDCVVLTTAHQAFDYALIAQHAKLIVDTRGAFKSFKQNTIVMA